MFTKCKVFVTRDYYMAYQYDTNLCVSNLFNLGEKFAQLSRWGLERSEQNNRIHHKLKQIHYYNLLVLLAAELHIHGLETHMTVFKSVMGGETLLVIQCEHHYTSFSKCLKSTFFYFWTKCLKCLLHISSQIFYFPGNSTKNAPTGTDGRITVNKFSGQQVALFQENLIIKSATPLTLALRSMI